MNYTQKIEQVTESTWDFLSSQGPLCIFLQESLDLSAFRILFKLISEYSYAAEPPVQFRLSHLSRRSEPL